MEIHAMHFKKRAGDKIADRKLQQNLARTRHKFVAARAQAMQELDDLPATRDAAAAIRDEVLKNLDVWLEKFESKASERGAQVLWARTADEVGAQVVEIAKRHGVKKAVKAKSMVTEEAGLNAALEAAGLQVVETDLGEYILQLNNNERPSHIIAPALHKSLDEVADLFARHHHTPRKEDIPALTREAREQLRGQFLSSEMGITGANFLIAETGSVALVTNEGNGRMVSTVPRIHVVITGIEKVIPRLEDLATLMRLLPRSATGQSISNYVSVLTGVKGAGDFDGPEHLYIILVDNGRVNLIGSEFEKMLRCIRGGA